MPPVVHKGAAVFGHRGYGRDLGLIIHLSASTALGPDPNNKVLVATVEEALKIGADAREHSRQCRRRGREPHALDFGRGLSRLPGVGHASAGHDVSPRKEDQGRILQQEYIAHAARVGAELGADIVKTNYTGDQDSFARVVESCPVPVVIAGGPRVESELDLLAMVEGAISAGARGVAIGRNVFQHENPALITRRICGVVHKGLSAREALQIATAE